VKSMHVLFPRAGHSDEPLRYEVRREHEGGTFASLTVTATQSRGTVAAAVLSLHAPEGGREQQTTAAVPRVPGEEARTDLGLIPWETRSTGDLDTRAAGAPEYEVWMRTPEADPELAAPLTAYATDLTLIGTALRALEGVGQRDAGTAFTSAVTSHSIWFHRPFRTENWLLLRQTAPIVAHGRSFGRGDVLTEEGALVASYAQEAMLRFK
jgi:acyl-CoA thioesterase-2